MKLRHLMLLLFLLNARFTTSMELITNRPHHLQLMVNYAKVSDTDMVTELVRNAPSYDHDDAVDIIKYFMPKRTVTMDAIADAIENDEDYIIDIEHEVFITSIDFYIDLYKEAPNDETLNALIPHIIKVYAGDQAVMDCYIAHYRKAKRMPQDKETPLHVAIDNNHLSIAQLLLAQNQDMINAQDNNGQIPLFNAVITANLNLCTFLLSFPNIQINLKNNMRLSALAAAADLGNFDIVRLLTHHNNQQAEQDNNTAPLYVTINECPWAHAIAHGNVKIVKFLLKPLNFTDKYPSKPLHIAAREQKIDIIKMLCDQPNTDVNAKNEDGYTALHIAAIFENTHIAQYLIRKNANINIQNNGKRTPLWCASQEGKDSMVALLLLQQAAVDMAADGNITPLSIAVLEGHYTIASMLLAAGANANTKLEEDNFTPLMLATQKNNYNMTHLLLENRALVDEKDTEGYTSLLFATAHNYIDIMKLLLFYKANPNKKFKVTPLHCSAEDKNCNAAKLLLAYGALVDTRDADGWTALMIATELNDKAMVKLLVENGASTHKQNPEGYKAIDLTNNNEIKELLTSTKTNEKCLIC